MEDRTICILWKGAQKNPTNQTKTHKKKHNIVCATAFLCNTISALTPCHFFQQFLLPLVTQSWKTQYLNDHSKFFFLREGGSSRGIVYKDQSAEIRKHSLVCFSSGIFWGHSAATALQQYICQKKRRTLATQLLQFKRAICSKSKIHFWKKSVNKK